MVQATQQAMNQSRPDHCGIQRQSERQDALTLVHGAGETSSQRLWQCQQRTAWSICLYSHGQPQWRRKHTTVGLLSGVGSCSFDVDGAFSPTAGVVPSFTAAGDIHDQNSVCQVIVECYRYCQRVSLHEESDTSWWEKQVSLYCPLAGRGGAALKASYAGSQVATISPRRTRY
jgi:hypothetical protein